MKKIVVIFLVISSLFSFLISFRETSNKQIEEFEQLDSSIGQPFTIPDDPLLNDPKEMIELIMSSSKNIMLIFFGRLLISLQTIKWKFLSIYY